MTNAEYLEATAVTETVDYAAVGERLTKYARILHHAMGLVTEAGEIMDALKKAAIYGKELDVVNILEELGDIQWYYARMIATLNEDFGMNTSMEQIMDTNIAKLRKRYGDKFTENKASVRNLEAERELLERGFSPESVDSVMNGLDQAGQTFTEDAKTLGLMDALRASVEAAKKRQKYSDELDDEGKEIK